MLEAYIIFNIKWDRSEKRYLGKWFACEKNINKFVKTARDRVVRLSSSDLCRAVENLLDWRNEHRAPSIEQLRDRKIYKNQSLDRIYMVYRILYDYTVVNKIARLENSWPIDSTQTRKRPKNEQNYAKALQRRRLTPIRNFHILITWKLPFFNSCAISPGLWCGTERLFSFFLFLLLSLSLSLRFRISWKCIDCQTVHWLSPVRAIWAFSCYLYSLECDESINQSIN